MDEKTWSEEFIFIIDERNIISHEQEKDVNIRGVNKNNCNLLIFELITIFKVYVILLKVRVNYPF